jgi:hypothetical protein
MDFNLEFSALATFGQLFQNSCKKMDCSIEIESFRKAEGGHNDSS